MDRILSQFPILAYLLSQIDPATHPPLPPEIHQDLISHFPHLPNPKVFSSLAQSIPITVTQTLLLIRSLGPRPDPAAVSLARSKISEGLRPAEAEIYKAVVRLEEMYEAYERQLSEVEEKLGRVYGSVVEEVGRQDGKVNEEVVAILKEAESRVVERVELPGRQLRILPEAFGKLHGLVSLNLSHNELEVIPDSIAGLQKLEELNLSSNLLQFLPDSIGLLLNLKILNVSGNKLNALPESIARCSSLVELDASFNNLAVLPTNIGYGLLNLEKLSIQLNKIRYLPSSVCEMRSLKYLDVHFNELRGLPQAIGRLTNLEVLNLGSNFSDLKELPETLGDLTNLKELDLSNNQIRYLPDTFGRLENLTKLNLDQNPLVIPPMEIANKGAEAVREFMAKRWLDIVAEEQQKSMLEANKQRAQTGWWGWGTSLINGVVSGVGGYISGGKASSDPYLDQPL